MADVKSDKAGGYVKPSEQDGYLVVNRGAAPVKVRPDRWTVVTADGKPSAHWEHTLLITEGPAEVLTRRADETD